jgi:hypothetical protein
MESDNTSLYLIIYFLNFSMMGEIDFFSLYLIQSELAWSNEFQCGKKLLPIVKITKNGTSM